MSPEQKHLIFFADPMCSWCWGFAPVIEKLRGQFGDRLPIKLVMGGLRVDQIAPMEDRIKSEIKTHWTHVEKMTGQKFDYAFFEREDFIYDTEKACRAVVTMRRLFPDDWNRPLDYMTKIHQAFYVDGLDTTDKAVLLELAVGLWAEKAAFDEEFENSKTKRETRLDILMTQQTGIQGFPSILAGSEEAGFMVVSAGYSDYDTIGDPITQWLEG